MIALLLGLALATPAAQAPVGDRYAVGAIKADFKARRPIGTRRAGLVCLPAGSFKWSDARAALADAGAAVATVLHDQAPTMFDAADDPFSDDRAATRFKLIATIDDFTVNACVRNWGIAGRLRHGGGLTGRIHIAVTWDVFDRVTRSRIAQHVITTDGEVAPGTGDAQDALLAVLKANAVQFVRQNLPTPVAR